MEKRSYWLDLINKAWKRRSVIWLSGVRRVGKTTLCKTIPEAIYLDCELPSVRRQLDNPETFLSSHVGGPPLVFDEIHRLRDPSELLKIAADHFPSIKILATGSSTLGASAKFSDTLTGRKIEIWLTPLIAADLVDFGVNDLDRRLWHGGLPSFFLDMKMGERDVQEWMDAYWSRDILSLFRLGRRDSFLKFMELLYASSGGIFEATTFARPCEVDRKTISNFLRVLEATHTAHRIQPYSSGKPSEIISAPKVYGFDTGFVTALKGWRQRRPEDRGFLWEHYVLNEIHARLQTRRIYYWRDKRGHEIDFVIALPGQSPIAIECKSSSDTVRIDGFRSFLQRFPGAACCVVTPDVKAPHERKEGPLTLHFLNLENLIELLLKRRDG